MKLMIVDDHPATRKMIRQLLAGPDVTVCECDSGEEALLRAPEFQPEWITMDIHMPGQNGLKTTTEIKKLYPASRILIVTADNQPYLRGMAHLAGATGYVCKDNLMELRSFVRPAQTETAAPLPLQPGNDLSTCQL